MDGSYHPDDITWRPIVVKHTLQGFHTEIGVCTCVQVVSKNAVKIETQGMFFLVKNDVDVKVVEFGPVGSVVWIGSQIDIFCGLWITNMVF